MYKKVDQDLEKVYYNYFMLNIYLLYKMSNFNIYWNSKCILENQTKRLADIFKYELLSTGDILRNEVASKGPYADEISSHIDVGELVPDVSIFKWINNKEIII